MIRAGIYLVAAGIVWGGEGYVFSQMLGFTRLQTALTAAVYLALFLLACTLLARFAAGQSDIGGLARWRSLSLAPMLTAVLGSFISLPLLLVIAALARVT